MFAIIKTGGKQYRVAKDETVTIERLPGEAGAKVSFAEVLLVSDGATTRVGSPMLSGATVEGEIVEQGRAEKVIAFKKRRRKNSQKRRGHRQPLTTVRISEIRAA